MDRLKRRARRRADGIKFALCNGSTGNRKVRGRFYSEIRFPVITNNSIRGAQNLTLNFCRGSRVNVFRNAGSGITIGNFSTPYQSAGTITANALRNQTTITTSASPLAPGFYWLGVGTTVHVNTPGLDRSSGGEIIRVVSSVGTTATLERPLINNYTSGATILMLDNQGDRNRFLVQNISIRNLKAYGFRNITGQHVAVSLGLNVSLDNCEFTGALTQCAFLYQLSGVRVNNCRIAECGTGVGNGYGIAPILSQRIFIDNVTSIRSRHTVSFARGCSEASVSRLGAVLPDNAVLDDHDGTNHVTATWITAPSARISLGNTTWPLESLNFTVNNFNVRHISLAMRRINNFFNDGTFQFLESTASAGGRTVISSLYDNMRFTNCNITGNPTRYPVPIGDDDVQPHNLQGVLFTNCTINGTQTGPGHCIEFRRLFAAPTGYTFNIRFVGCTITPGGDGGARAIRQTGTGTGNPNITIDLENCVINPAVTAPVQTVIREGTQTGGVMTVVHSGTTFRGSAFTNANLSGVTGVIRT